jgi:hypothetical protein
MSQELHYTSLPRGLAPGSHGFCTVACTPRMARPLAERLENLSGYRQVFPPHSPSAALNPIHFSHVKLEIGDRSLSVLSRIGPAGLDYSGRINKYAHHVVLEPEERPEGGPAWLLAQPGFLQTAWEGDARVLPQGRRPPAGDRPAGIASAWHAATGDAGWAGALAESFLADRARPVFLVYRPGMDLLPLLIEAIALLPVSQRWEVAFSTYFTTMPQGVYCPWRGVLEDSPGATSATRIPHALIIDLCRPMEPAHGGALVELARTGRRWEAPAAANVALRGPVKPREPIPVAGGPVPVARAPVRGGAAGNELIPDLVARMRIQASDEAGSLLLARRRGRTRAVVATIAATCLVPLVAAGTFVWLELGRRRASPASAQEASLTAKEVPSGARTAKPEIEQPGALQAKAEPAAKTNEARDGSSAVEAAQADAKKPLRDWGGQKPPSAGSRHPAGPHLRFIALPKVPDGRQSPRKTIPPKPGQTKATSMVTADLPAGADSIVGIRNVSDQLVLPRPGTSIQIQSQPRGLGRRNVPIATVEIVNERILRFSWDPELGHHGEWNLFANAVRDIVLKVNSRGSDEIDVLLRDPGPVGPQSLELVNPIQLLIGRRGLRNNTTAWAARKDELAGTKWKLGIRRWKIVNRLRIAGAAGPALVVSEGTQPDGQIERVVKARVGDGEASLHVAIMPEEPERIRVTFEYDDLRLSAFRGRRDELYLRYMIDPRKPDATDGRPPRPPAIHEQLTDLAAKLKRPQEVKRLHIEDADLAELKEIVRKDILFHFFDHSQRSKLHLVIGLQLDDGTILDIARFGEFADLGP